MKRVIALMTMLAATAAVAFAVTGAATADEIALKITFMDVTCTPTSDGQNISCSGKITGLGNTQNVVISVEATRVCTNRGDNQPPGQIRGQSSPLPVRNGSVTFNNVETQAKACPDQMTATFGPTATVCVTATQGTLPGGETSHCEPVPIT
jgi:type 1 fimbria pilin